MKLLIVGWDGATGSHLQRLRPPFYESLPFGGELLPERLFEGAYIDSANAWTTITTGVPLKEHGVLLFRYPPMRTKTMRFKVTAALAGLSFLPGIVRRLLITRVMGPWCKQRRAGVPEPAERWRGNFKGRLLPAVSADIRYPRFWDYLPGRALIFGVPVTYPALVLNGILVSGIPSPRFGEAQHPTVYPADLEEEIRTRFPGFYYTDGESPLETPARRNLESYLENVPLVHERAVSTFLDLAKRGSYALGFLLLPLLDDWLHADDDWNGIERMYRLIDGSTQRLVDELNPEEVLVLSDHGMKPFRRPGLGIRMDHDTEDGVWAATSDLQLRRHTDVCPAILNLFGQSFEPQTRVPAIEESDIDFENEQEQREVEEHLRQLGYL